MTGAPITALYPTSQAAGPDRADGADAKAGAPLYPSTQIEAPAPAIVEPPAVGPGATLYEQPPETREYVRWDEPAATPGTISLQAPADEGWDRTPEGDAARTRLGDAMAAAGAGTTFAQEVWRDAVAASRQDYQPASKDAALVDLQKAWGAKFEENVAAAQRLVQAAARHDPSIIEYLDQTGLGNDPKFIRKLAARAAKVR